METYILTFTFFWSEGPLSLSPIYRDYSSRAAATEDAAAYANRLSEHFDTVVSFDIRKSRRSA